MSKLFRDWYDNVDRDSQEYKDFINQQEYDEWAYNLSLIHIPSPRDRTRSRMPSTA